MGDSRGTADAPVLRALRDAVAAAVPRSRDDARATRVAIALSGGRDSMVLLDAFARISPECGVALSAAHVHHGLSPHADAWAQFCAAQCEARGVPLTVHRVRVERSGGESLEAAARSARYTALSTVAADYVALAHHADDQAETLLLQLLRGAGPHGLAGMPALRPTPSGPALLRPFLALPRAAIDDYAGLRSLAWVDDESNANVEVKRNFVRHEIAGRLAAAFPGYPVTLARSAAHQAEMAALVDELAALDAQQAIDHDTENGATLDRQALSALERQAPHRARNLLRWFLRQHHLRPPSTARLAEMLRQLAHAALDARVRLIHGGAEIGMHRGRIVVHAPTIAPFALTWHGEALLALPHGTLSFTSGLGAGIACTALQPRGTTIRSRQGGERIRIAPNRPRQALKRLLHDAGVPVWQRESLPLVFCGETLAAVPGIGVDVAYQATSDAIGYAITWLPGDGAG